MNVFLDKDIAEKYDAYYQTPEGSRVDEIEKSLIKKLLPPLSCGNKMLEMGCGTGHWTSFFSENGFLITACDISEPMLELAKKKNIKNVVLESASVLDIPFENCSFDIVSAITMLEFTGNAEKALDEMFRVLKVGGSLILGCLNLHSIVGKNKQNDPTFENAQFFDKETLGKMLLKYGKPEIKEGVYLSEQFELLDRTMESYPVEGVFLAIHTTKI